MARSAPDRKGSVLSPIQALAIASQLAITLAVSAVLGLFVGQWLDGRFGTGFVFTLIGVFLGIAAGVSGAVSLYRASLGRGTLRGTARTPSSAGDRSDANEGHTEP